MARLQVVVLEEAVEISLDLRRLDVPGRSAERILRVEILWPSGGPPQILEGLELDRRYIVREGSGVRALNLKPFKLGTVTP